MCIAAIGIDEYRAHRRLDNAVRDARGVLRAFERLGFQQVVEPLFDAAATRTALCDLVTDVLGGELTHDDSLVLFFAGHGESVKRNNHGDGPAMPGKGYLLPFDADERRSSWLDLRPWLSDVARLAPRHILVILDSCYSGIALDGEAQARGYGPPVDPRLDSLRARRSRRVITSAQDNQLAADSGPLRGHSLFAGCLIEAIRGGIAAQTRAADATGEYLGVYVQAQVRLREGVKQTPETGTLEGHYAGELVLPLGNLARRAQPSRRPRPKPPAPVAPRPRSSEEVAVTERTEGWTIDPACLDRLDRHRAERECGCRVLSALAGDALATQTAWATWAARHGYLTLATEASDPEVAVADLLAQTPWLRCLSEARKRLAAAARIDVDAVDAALDARGPRDRGVWIKDRAGRDRHAEVSGWLLSALRESSARVPDLTKAPVRGEQLLEIACDLACPTAVLVQCAAPDAAWLERAIATAALLTSYLPRHAIAVAAPEAVMASVLDSPRDGAALTMARQGRVTLAIPAQRLPGRGRYRTARALFDALACDPRTRGRFTLDAEVALGEGGPAIDIDLLAAGARIAVEIDGWHHFYDAESYRRDRVQDMRLQRAGYFVMRFLAEDVDQRLAAAIDDIALALVSRRAQEGSS